MATFAPWSTSQFAPRSTCQFPQRTAAAYDRLINKTIEMVSQTIAGETPVSGAPIGFV